MNTDPATYDWSHLGAGTIPAVGLNIEPAVREALDSLAILEAKVLSRAIALLLTRPLNPDEKREFDAICATEGDRTDLLLDLQSRLAKIAGDWTPGHWDALDALQVPVINQRDDNDHYFYERGNPETDPLARLAIEGPRRGRREYGESGYLERSYPPTE